MIGWLFKATENRQRRYGICLLGHTGVRRQPAAIKVLALDLCCDKKARHRVERGSKIITISTPENIIQQIERGITADEMPYFVMKYLEASIWAQPLRSMRFLLSTRSIPLSNFSKRFPMRARKERAPPDSPGARFLALGKRNKSPTSARTGFLFGLLLLIFVQYLTLFDG